MINLLAKILLDDYKDTKNPKVRQVYGMLCGIVGIILNLLLFLIKILAGKLAGSIAITADAFNNLSDVGSSVVTLFGFKMAGQKPDSDHPFGHGRIEYISGFVVSILILFMGFELAKSSVDKILHPQAVEVGPAVFGILILSVCVKFYMFLYNRSIAKKFDSAAMMATAKDSISDSISTIVVLLTMLITLFADVHIDGWCGLLVAAFVFYAGYGSAKDTISPLLGQPPEPEFVQKIEDIIMEYQEQGVLGIHDLVVHNYGPGRVMLSVHVEVPSSGDILALHDMIDLIEHRLARELRCSAVIHMDPVSVDDELTNEMKQRVAEIVEQMEGNITFHDFRIVHGPTHTNIIFDVLVPFDVKCSEEEIVELLGEKIHAFSTEDMEYFAVIDVDRDMYGSSNK